MHYSRFKTTTKKRPVNIITTNDLKTIKQKKRQKVHFSTHSKFLKRSVNIHNETKITSLPTYSLVHIYAICMPE